MRKLLLMLLLAITVFATGCGHEDANTSQNTQDEIENDNSSEESTNQENDNSEQNTFSNDDGSDKLGDYMTSLKEQSDILKASLENDELTQYEMNTKSQELYMLWDDALNYLWEELKSSLPEDEFAKLLDEQRTWITEKEKAVEEAGKEAEGGSLYTLVVNMEAAEITEKRVYELYELLK